ncbi:mRNA cap guanine-N7 methyltransferase-like [Dendronephthya gigantea]|uniref:mRNA cap guanine-N7 methyltransferase-like n=1 Tax=Dendronephthya gigantea TaxID=151771 RepID=UPI00106D0C6D|nr:mRNA cap guanine-N7 methyltransferase-like [Dendronephthya gigantea]
MADPQEIDQTQMEGATESLEEEQPKPMEEEQSKDETEEVAQKAKENGHETDEAAPRVENEEEKGKALEIGDKVANEEDTTEGKPTGDTQEKASENPKEEEKGLGATVAKHYNEHKEHTREERKTSPIFYLRNFNNWVKSVLINEFMEKYKRRTFRNLSVLDIGCGKGGDLIKWQKARISNLVCADIAEVSMNQCEQRYRDLRYGRNNRRYNQTQKIYDAQFITADCTKEDISQKFNSRNREVEFDMTSCQFALHYAFESPEQAERMLQNACERLKPGGYFIGTIPCANEIINRVRQSEGMSIENDCYKITFTEKENIALFGHKYDFHLEGVVDCPEFVVHFPLLEKMATKFGLTLELAQGFHDFFEDHKDKDDYRFLLNRMNALETYPPRREGDKLASENEDAYLQAKEFLGEADENDERKQVGTLSKDEWEATGLYMAFAFKKAEQKLEQTPSEEVQATQVSNTGQSEQQTEKMEGDKEDAVKDVEEQKTEAEMVKGGEGDKNDGDADKKEDHEMEVEDVDKEKIGDKKDEDSEIDAEKLDKSGANDEDVDNDQDADKKDEVEDNKSSDVFQGGETSEQGGEKEEETEMPTPQRGGRRKRSAGAAKDEAPTPNEESPETKRTTRKRKSAGGDEEEPPEKKKA